MLHGAKLNGADLSRANLSGVIFHIYTWKGHVFSNFKRVLEFFGIELDEEIIKEYIRIDENIVELEDMDIVLQKDEPKLIIGGNENQLIREEDRLYLKVYVDEYTNTEGIILTYSKKDEDIIHALYNLPPNLRKIVLRDNPNYKELWNNK